MSWGPYWMYYKCGKCGIHFKSQLDGIEEKGFGICKKCNCQADFMGERGSEPKENLSEYIEQ